VPGPSRQRVKNAGVPEPKTSGRGGNRKKDEGGHPVPRSQRKLGQERRAPERKHGYITPPKRGAIQRDGTPKGGGKSQGEGQVKQTPQRSRNITGRAGDWVKGKKKEKREMT